MEALKQEVAAFAALMQARYGERSTVILMVGIPIPGSVHDRFAAKTLGPCLSSRGLLAWGTEAIKVEIDQGDSSRNGKEHP